MNIDTGKFAVAAGISAALLWIVCSVFVWVAPGMMMSMTGYMLHADLSETHWQLTLNGVLAGLIIGSAFAGLTGYLLAGIYNRLANRHSG